MPPTKVPHSANPNLTGANETKPAMTAVEAEESSWRS